jgi:hypothetical protein
LKKRLVPFAKKNRAFFEKEQGLLEMSGCKIASVITHRRGKCTSETARDRAIASKSTVRSIRAAGGWIIRRRGIGAARIGAALSVGCGKAAPANRFEAIALGA